MLMQIDFRGQLAIVTSDGGKGGKERKEDIFYPAAVMQLFTRVYRDLFTRRGTRYFVVIVM